MIAISFKQNLYLLVIWIDGNTILPMNWWQTLHNFPDESTHFNSSFSRKKKSFFFLKSGRRQDNDRKRRQITDLMVQLLNLKRTEREIKRQWMSTLYYLLADSSYINDLLFACHRCQERKQIIQRIYTNVNELKKNISVWRRSRNFGSSNCFKFFHCSGEQCHCSGLYASYWSDLSPIFELYDHHWPKPTCEDLPDSSSHN